MRANYEIAAKLSLADMAWAHTEQTRIFRRFQQTFRDYDLVLSPTTPVSPFPWTQLYLAEMDGKPLRNYYHWLSLTYVITLATNPAISIPCGIDHKGMPFGLQVVGRFRADRVLSAIARDRAGLCWHPIARASRARCEQAHATHAGTEVDRHASAESGHGHGGESRLSSWEQAGRDPGAICYLETITARSMRRARIASAAHPVSSNTPMT